MAKAVTLPKSATHLPHLPAKAAVNPAIIGMRMSSTLISLNYNPQLI